MLFRSWQLNRIPVVSLAANWLVKTLLNIKYNRTSNDVLTGTRCLPRSVFINMNTISRGFSIETEITRKAIEMNMKIENFPVRFVNRSYKEGKKISIKHLPGIIKTALIKTPVTNFNQIIVSEPIKNTN